MKATNVIQVDFVKKIPLPDDVLSAKELNRLEKRLRQIEKVLESCDESDIIFNLESEITEILEVLENNYELAIRMELAKAS